MSTRYFELEVEGNGGEYSCGVVTAPEEIEYLKKRASEDELDLYNENEDANEDGVAAISEIRVFDYENILHIHGVNLLDDPIFTVCELRAGANGEFVPESYISDEPVWSGDSLAAVEMYGPYFDPSLIEKYGDDAVILRGCAYDKRLSEKYLIRTKDENFSPEKLVLLTYGLDEIFFVGDIVADHFLYLDFERFYRSLSNTVRGLESSMTLGQGDDLSASDLELCRRYLNEAHSNKHFGDEWLAVDNYNVIRELNDGFKHNHSIPPSENHELFILRDFMLEMIAGPEGRPSFDDVALLDLSGNKIE